MRTLREDLCIFMMMISRWIIHRMRNLSDKSFRESQNKRFMTNNFFTKIVPFMRQCGKRLKADRAQMTIWRMSAACLITKATDKHSEYVILIALPLLQWLYEHNSVLRLYVQCMSCLFFMVICCSLNVILAVLKNCHLELILRLSSKI
jgi:hypothetical protein